MKQLNAIWKKKKKRWQAILKSFCQAVTTLPGWFIVCKVRRGVNAKPNEVSPVSIPPLIVSGGQWETI